MRKPKRLPCREAGRKCQFNVAHEMVHNGLDGRVFQVRRLECIECGECSMVAEEQGRAFVPPTWVRGRAVEANF